MNLWLGLGAFAWFTIAAPSSLGRELQREGVTRDLSGTWTTADGTVLVVTQQGTHVEGRVVALHPMLVSVFGWRSGDLAFEGEIANDVIVGKAALHFPRVVRDKCPSQAVLMTDLTLQILGPGQLLGRSRNRIVREDCRVEDGPIGSLEFSRKSFTIQETEARIDVEIRDAVLFDLDRADLKPSSLAVLRELKRLVLDVQPFTRVLVNGHTDDQGADAYNLDLSNRRARAVTSWLITNGLPADRLEAKGYGKTQPRIGNSNPENRARNRRVEIVLIK